MLKDEHGDGKHRSLTYGENEYDLVDSVEMCRCFNVLKAKESVHFIVGDNLGVILERDGDTTNSNAKSSSIYRK